MKRCLLQEKLELPITLCSSSDLIEGKHSGI